MLARTGGFLVCLATLLAACAEKPAVAESAQPLSAATRQLLDRNSEFERDIIRGL